MKKIWLSIFVAIVLTLAACGSTDEGESSNHDSVDDKEERDKGIGFGLTGGTIEEAANVPAEEKEEILDVFDLYIDSFNEKDIDRYIEILADETESFDKEGERLHMEETFEQFEPSRKASDVTIVEYDETEAQVFSRMETTMKQLSSGLETTQTGRQVTVFKQEDGAWKVSSIHYLGDTEDKES